MPQLRLYQRKSSLATGNTRISHQQSQQPNCWQYHLARCRLYALTALLCVLLLWIPTALEHALVDDLVSRSAAATLLTESKQKPTTLHQHGPRTITQQQYNNHGQSSPLDLQPVHVVLSCGSNVVVALEANLESLAQNTKHPELLKLHFFQVEELPKEFFNVWLPSFLERHPQISWQLYKVQAEELQPYLNPHLTFQQRRLQADANFVRFILPNRLASNISSCLWMDADMIVWGDIVDWMNEYNPSIDHGNHDNPQTKEHAIAAFPRFRATFPFVNETWYPLFAQHNIPVSKDDSVTFNAGVLYLNLRYWRQQGIDAALRQIVALNAQYNFYPTSGSQAPLLLLFAGTANFKVLPLEHSIEYLGDKPVANETADRLDEQMQQQQRQGQGTKRNVDNTDNSLIMFLHWNGLNKPWYSNVGLNVKYWQPYAPQGFTPYPKWKDKPKEKADWKKKQKQLKLIKKQQMKQ